MAPPRQRRPARVQATTHDTTTYMYQTGLFSKSSRWGGPEGRQPLRGLPEALEDRVDVFKGFINFCSDLSTCEGKRSNCESETAPPGLLRGKITMSQQNH